LKIKELHLRNFRNYSERTFLFETQGAIITGPNGCGKTNLLEAISYFSNGKSVLGLKDTALISFKEDFFRISATFMAGEKKMQLEAAVNNEKKFIKMDKILLKRISELYPYIKSIYFSPQDIQLIDGFPAKRRNFFDFSISQLHYEYVFTLRNYLRILQQRNALLKQSYDSTEKKSWDDEFVHSACQITDYRVSYLSSILPVLQQKFEFITNFKESVELQYQYSFPRLGTDYAQELREKLNRYEKLEQKNERTMFGPHLADYHFTMNGKPIRYYGSQGQKRCLVIALSLAQAELIKQSYWGCPILMFDDVLAALDDERTEQSLKLLSNQHQIFIATPHPEQFRNVSLPAIKLGT
jgi:DNA replication and repair protein RecF